MPQTNNESEAKIPAKRRKSPRRRWKRALLLLVLMTLLILRVERNVTDVVLTLSQATARSLAIQALNEAASEMLGLGVHYADLMTVEKDDQGQVRLIQANTPEMNRLAAQASLLAQERLTAMGQKTVVVPLGSAIGLTLLAGAGHRRADSACRLGAGGVQHRFHHRRHQPDTPPHFPRPHRERANRHSDRREKRAGQHADGDGGKHHRRASAGFLRRGRQRQQHHRPCAVRGNGV